MKCVIARRTISPQELRSIYGESVNLPETQCAIENSLAVVSASVEGEVVGFGRLVGDVGRYVYVQDLMVLPKYRGCGVGKAIMEEFHTIVRELAGSRKQILLIADDSVKSFYEKLGYEDTGRRNHLMRLQLE